MSEANRKLLCLDKPTKDYLATPEAAKLLVLLQDAIRRRGHCLTQTACRDTGLLKFGDAGTEFENIVIAKNVTLDRANAVLKKALKDGKVTRYGKQEWQVL
jgi:uncharacterized protein YaaR (DUF327 family)